MERFQALLNLGGALSAFNHPPACTALPGSVEEEPEPDDGAHAAAAADDETKDDDKKDAAPSAVVGAGAGAV